MHGWVKDTPQLPKVSVLVLFQFILYPCLRTLILCWKWRTIKRLRDNKL